MPVVTVPHVPANRSQHQDRHLIGETENAQQRRRIRQPVHQPQLRRGLHPRADQRGELSREKQLEVAVLQSAEARGHERGIPPSIGRRTPSMRRNIYDDVPTGPLSIRRPTPARSNLPLHRKIHGAGTQNLRRKAVSSQRSVFCCLFLVLGFWSEKTNYLFRGSSASAAVRRQLLRCSALAELRVRKIPRQPKQTEHWRIGLPRRKNYRGMAVKEGELFSDQKPKTDS